MTSCTLGSVRVEKVENESFFVFHSICLKFGMGGGGGEFWDANYKKT